MQVPKPSLQHATMIEAVENHMPEVIVVDEIGTEEETKACRTIAERGVQLVGTAHGYQLENLIKNPILADLIGGFQNVVLGDEEAKFRGTNKTVIERKGPPTFDVIIELHARDIFIIYNPVAKYIDAYLNNDSIEGELRKRKKDGQVTITKEIPIKNKEIPQQEEKAIFPFGISTKKLKDIGKSLGIPLKIVSEINEADLILTTKSKTGPKSKVSQLAKAHQLSLHIITSQEEEKLIKFLHSLFKVTPNTDYEEEVRQETKLACEQVLKESSFVELPPQPIYLRTIQHEIAHHYGLNSMSVGESPNRRLRVYPRI